MNSEINALFKQTFGHPPTSVVQAPGRLELIGNHTDYNQGLVMALAVDKYIWMAASPRTDGQIELVSSAFPSRERFMADTLQKNPAADWTNYIKGVLDQLRKRRVHYSGFNAVVHSSLPLGAGMSSSAALEVSAALTMRNLFPYTLGSMGERTPPARNAQGELPPPDNAEKLELAKLCQAAENQFVGVQCGLLDQISSLFGKTAHAIEIDCQSLAVETVPMIGEIAIVVCNTGVKHALVGGEYNALRQLCEAAARKLGAKSLRAVEPRQLTERKHELTEREYQCAYHVVGEIQRVIFGARALRDGDFAQFGQYMLQSHESSRDYFKNSAPELDMLVDIARGHAGCLGARLTGGGFGGATINLVKRDAVEDFKAFVARDYAKRSGRETKPMVCQIVEGAK